jgi:alpha-glucosidase
VPIPWTAASAGHFGFGPVGGAAPWLPQPDRFALWAVDVESGEAGSTLALVRAVLERRRALPALGEGTLTWLSAPGDAVLAFRRDPGFVCVVNLSDDAVALPSHERVLLTSGTLEAGLLPPDTAVWLAVD